MAENFWKCRNNPPPFLYEISGEIMKYQRNSRDKRKSKFSGGPSEENGMSGSRSDSLLFYDKIRVPFCKNSEKQSIFIGNIVVSERDFRLAKK